MQALAPIKVLYVDGGCRNTTTRVGAYAFVCVEMESVNNIKSPSSSGELLFGYTQRVEDTTNNIMELQAVLEGLVECNRRAVTPTHIVTDSQYVQKGIVEWSPSWIMRGWRTSSGGEVRNKALWKELLKWYKPAVGLIHIRGHQGIFWNEVCDDYCTKSMNSKCNDVRKIQ